MEAITLHPELDEHVMNYVAFLMRRGFCDEALVQMHRLAKPCARDPDWRKAIETWCTAFPEYAERIRTECQTL